MNSLLKTALLVIILIHRPAANCFNTQKHTVNSPIRLSAPAFIDSEPFSNLMVDRFGHVLLSNCHRNNQACQVVSLVVLLCDPALTLKELVQMKPENASDSLLEIVRLRFGGSGKDEETYEFVLLLKSHDTFLIVKEPCLDDDQCLTSSLRCVNGWIDFSNSQGRRQIRLADRVVDVKRSNRRNWWISLDKTIRLGGSDKVGRARRTTDDSLKVYEKSFDGQLNVHYVFTSPNSYSSLKQSRLLTFDRDVADFERIDRLTRGDEVCEADCGAEEALNLLDANDNVRIIDFNDNLLDKPEECDSAFCPDGMCQPTGLHRECDLQTDLRFGSVGNSCVVQYSCMPKSRMISCSTGERCSRFAVCTRLNDTEFYCVCRDGFVGNGETCSPVECNLFHNCDENADCYYDSDMFKHMCKCRNGFDGDGYSCEKRICVRNANCGSNAKCVPDSKKSYTQYCTCDPGYVGDGYFCVPNVRTCMDFNNCHPNADCAFQGLLQRFMCKCRAGYVGDGYQCYLKNSCELGDMACDRNAICVYSEYFREQICRCKSGFVGNGRRCYEIDDGNREIMIVLSQNEHLIKYNTSSIPVATQDNYHKILMKALSVSFDCRSKRLYMTDANSRSIAWFNVNNDHYKFILTNLSQPEGLAVDWISRLIFWSDSKERKIVVSAMDGTMRKVIVSEGISRPRSVAVSPEEGFVFWADWDSRKPRIERANMDGTGRHVLVSERIKLPNGIAFHQRSGELCWVDAGTKLVECVRSDGNNRRILYRDDDSYMFSIATGHSHLYWTDWARNSIGVVSVAKDDDGSSAEARTYRAPFAEPPYGISAVFSECPSGVTNVCGSKNHGGCPGSMLCLPNPDIYMDRICSCPDDSKLCLIYGGGGEIPPPPN